jgi:hypothetical protein
MIIMQMKLREVAIYSLEVTGSTAEGSPRLALTQSPIFEPTLSPRILVRSQRVLFEICITTCSVTCRPPVFVWRYLQY